MRLLRESDLYFTGMSSGGPSIAIVTERSREEAERLKKIGLEIAIETKVDNEGQRMEWE